MAHVAPGWRNSLDSRISAIGISQNALAALAGLPVNKLSGFFCGIRKLENPELEKLHGILVSCEELAKLAEPIPIDFKNLISLRVALEKMKDGDLSPVLARSEEVGA